MGKAGKLELVRQVCIKVTRPRVHDVSIVEEEGRGCLFSNWKYCT